MAVEQKVREIVADYFVKRAKAVCDSNPDLDDVIRKSAENSLEKRLDEFVLAGKMNIEEAYTLKQDLDEEFEDFTYTKNYFQDLRDSWLKGKESCEEEYKSFLEDAALMKMYPELAPFHDELSSASQDILSYLGRRDNVIYMLVQKAENEGIEAIDTDAIKAAIRQEYPIAEDYLQSYGNLAKAAIKLMNSLIKLSSPLTSLNEFVTEINHAFLYGVTEGCIEVFVKKDVEVIYGKDCLSSLQP